MDGLGQLKSTQDAKNETLLIPTFMCFLVNIVGRGTIPTEISFYHIKHHKTGGSGISATLPSHS